MATIASLSAQIPHSFSPSGAEVISHVHHGIGEERRTKTASMNRGMRFDPRNSSGTAACNRPLPVFGASTPAEWHRHSVSTSLHHEAEGEQIRLARHPCPLARFGTEYCPRTRRPPTPRYAPFADRPRWRPSSAAKAIGLLQPLHKAHPREFAQRTARTCRGRSAKRADDACRTPQPGPLNEGRSASTSARNCAGRQRAGRHAPPPTSRS